MPKGPTDHILPRLRKLALSLPGTSETLTWGHPNFRVDGKIFIGYGEQGGHRVAGFKVGKERQRILLRDSRYRYPSYVGRFGWVSLIMEGRIDWNEVAGLLLTSYRLIAPRRLLNRLDEDAPRTPRVRRSKGR